MPQTKPADPLLVAVGRATDPFGIDGESLSPQRPVPSEVIERLGSLGIKLCYEPGLDVHRLLRAGDSVTRRRGLTPNEADAVWLRELAAEYARLA